VVAAKSVVTTVALLALLSAAAARADAPTVRIAAADQVRAEAALLRLSDIGAGWQGGRVPTSKLTAPNCPGFDPKESDLVVTGHADARFSNPRASATLAQDVQVLRSERAVRTDFARTITSGLGRCLAYQLKKEPGVASVSVARIAFPKLGTIAAAYRATLLLKTVHGTVKFYGDYVFIGTGRYEFALRVLAPSPVVDQLVNFETAMARILIKRLGKPCC
jgi:hypothetical protein